MHKVEAEVHKQIIYPVSPQFYKEVLEYYDDKKISLTFARHRKERSYKQLKYYWGVLLEYFNNPEHGGLGYPNKYDLHYELKRLFLNELYINRLTGEEEIRVRSLGDKNLTTIDVEDYFEKCRMFAAQEFGIIIPLPGEGDI